MSSFADFVKQKSMEKQQNAEAPKPMGLPKLNLNSAPPKASPTQPTQPTQPAQIAKPKNALASLALMEVDEPTPSMALPQIELPSDHIAPDKPDRELLEDAPEEHKQFVSLVDGLYDSFDDADLFIGLFQRVMTEMQNSPHLEMLLAPADVQTMLRGLRGSAGLQQIKKQSKQRKSSSGKPLKGLNPDMMVALQGLAAGFKDD